MHVNVDHFEISIAETTVPAHVAAHLSFSKLRWPNFDFSCSVLSKERTACQIILGPTQFSPLMPANPPHPTRGNKGAYSLTQILLMGLGIRIYLIYGGLFPWSQWYPTLRDFFALSTPISNWNRCV
jgi:hypothetical protein